MSPAKRMRLESSWAEVFRTKSLPLIDEEPFRNIFAPVMGRPNASIRLLFGLLVLKDMFDLTDNEALDHLEFNLQWQHALGVEPGTAHLCQKTLHNFRKRLLDHGLAEQFFTQMVKAMAQADGVDIRVQRLDSTHVISNIAVLTRLGLFVETVSNFLKRLRKEAPKRWSELPTGYGKRYLEREGYFADAKKNASRRRLIAVAQDAYRLVERFREDEVVSQLEAYELLYRLVEEQCEVVDKKAADTEQEQAGGESGKEALQLTVFTQQSEGAAASAELAAGEDEVPARVEDEEGDAEASQVDGGLGEDLGSEADSGAVEERSVSCEGSEQSQECEPERQVRLKGPKEVGSDTLQSPYDPDATYGHKGKGYEVQIAETCGEDNPYQLVTDVEVNGAHESDQKALIPVLERQEEAGLKPERMYADTNYGSGENIVEAGKREVELKAPVQDPKRKRLRAGSWEDAVESEASATLSSQEEMEEQELSHDTGGQALPGELGLGDFSYSLDYQQIECCPGGHQPQYHRGRDEDRARVAYFEKESCAECQFSGICPTRERGRLFQGEIAYQPEKAATAYRQREQQSSEFKEAYRIRSGIEATNSILKGPHGADDLRVRGKPKVKLNMVMKSAALNVRRCIRYHLGRLRTADATGGMAIAT